MALDYAKLAVTAERLISQNGGDCEFSRIGTAAADPEKPWRTLGGACAVTKTVKAVIVPMEFKDEEGKTVRRADKATLYTLTDFDGEEPKTFDFVSDGFQKWKICDVQPIAPAGPNSKVCYIMELEG